MGLKELFYNPYTKQEGKFGIKGNQQIKSFPNHDDHLHIASDNADEMQQIMDVAHNQYGLTVHENPYATEKGWDPDGVQKVHASGSNHYRTLGNGKIGGAADITGNQQKIFDFIDNYIYKQVFKDGKNLKPATPGGSVNTSLDSGSGKPGSQGGSTSVGGSSTSSSGSLSNAREFVKGLLNQTLGGQGLTPKPTNEEMELPVDENPTSLDGSKYVFKNKKIDNTFYSPYDGIVDSVSKDSNDEYTIIIKHRYSEGGKNDNLISTISGFSKINPNISNGSRISNGNLIGYMDDGDTLVWTLTDKNGKKVKIKDYLENNESGKNNKNTKNSEYNSKTPRLNKAPGLVKFALNYLNPFAIPFGIAKAAKKIGYQKESTQENKVLTEEIQRIKNLMK